MSTKRRRVQADQTCESTGGSEVVPEVVPPVGIQAAAPAETRTAAVQTTSQPAPAPAARARAGGVAGRLPRKPAVSTTAGIGVELSGEDHTAKWVRKQLPAGIVQQIVHDTKSVVADTSAFVSDTIKSFSELVIVKSGPKRLWYAAVAQLDVVPELLQDFLRAAVRTFEGIVKTPAANRDSALRDGLSRLKQPNCLSTWQAVSQTIWERTSATRPAIGEQQMHMDLFKHHMLECATDTFLAVIRTCMHVEIF
jgi:hypothetical protein